MLHSTDRWRTCPGCGQPFEAAHELQRHCSDVCRARTYRKRHRKRGGYCAHCFSYYPYTQTRGPRSRYCSNACKQKAYRQRLARRLRHQQRHQRLALRLAPAPAPGGATHDPVG